MDQSWNNFPIQAENLGGRGCGTQPRSPGTGVACRNPCHPEPGNLFSDCSYEQNAILRRGTDGSFETLVHDPRVLWPDTLSVARDGHLYFTANQLHRQARYHDGKDLRQKPYVLLRTPIDAGPVRLSR